MIAPSAPQHALLRQIIQTGDEGFRFGLDASDSPADILALALDGLVELTGDRPIATPQGRAFALRTVDA